MQGPEIVPFSEEHIGDAARLLGERHARSRALEPALPEVDYAAAVRELWEQDGASGAVAIREGRVAGYLLGTRSADAVWGPNVWAELAGHAAESAEDVRDLYAFAAARWVEEGRTAHYALVPAGEAALVEAWFRLGFGQQHALGIREVPDERQPEVSGVEVRKATPADVDGMVAIGPGLSEHQSRSPVFSTQQRKSDEETRADILEDLANAAAGNLLAVVEGRIVGTFVLVPVELSSRHGGLARPPRAALIGYAFTLPEVRGSGAGLALTWASFAWARDRGYDAIVTDWRVTNLLASRFWRRRGFRTTFLRLHRYIA
jgi:GNAT superfamily N-acetyltransferase